MRSLRTHRTLTLPVAVGGLLLLGACSAGETLDDPEESAAPTPSAEASEEAEDSDDAGETDEDSSDAASGGPDCLEGEWDVDLDSVLDAALSAPGFAELDPEIDVSGSSTVMFSDGTFTNEYAEQTTVLTWTLEDQEFENTTRYDGRMTGTYEATDTELTMTELDTSDVTLTNTTTINGEEIDLGTEDVVQDAFSADGTSTYECTDTELRLTPVLDGVDTSAFVSVFTRS